MIIVGRLADAPEIVATSRGQDMIRYALATNHGPKDNRQTSWWKVASFLPEGGARDLLMALGKGWVGIFFYLFFYFSCVRGCGREGGAGRWIWERWGPRLNGDDAFIDGTSNAVFGDEWRDSLADPLLPHSSLVYVEGDCSMNKFQSKDGIASSALNIVQSERFFFFRLCATRWDVLMAIFREF